MKVKAMDVIGQSVSKHHQSDLEDYLKSVTLLAGEGSFYENDDTVYVSIVHEGGSYHPGAVIVVADYGSADETIQAAFEVMQEYQMNHSREYLDEISKELVDEALQEHADDIASGRMTKEEVEQGVYDSGADWERWQETWDGYVWELPAKELARILKNDKSALEFIHVYEPEE